MNADYEKPGQPSVTPDDIRRFRQLGSKAPGHPEYHWVSGGETTTLTFEGAGYLQANSPGGKNLHYGIREHAMGAMANGMSLSKLRPFGATFFIFSDYARPSIRLYGIVK